jgi:hypothetical protein
MMKYLSIALLLFITGCINRATVTMAPGADLTGLKSFYVVHQPRDNDHLNQVMSDNLSMRGYQSTAGPELPQASYKTDAVITYVDKWMWDMTLYLLELTVTVRDPVQGQPLAVGNSYHTSLTRLSPKEMTDEVLANIFGPTTAPAKVDPVKDDFKQRGSNFGK